MRIIRASFVLLVICMPLHYQVWSLPLFGELLQPSEIAISIYITSSFLCLIKKEHNYTFSKVDIIPVVWLLINLFTNLFTVDFDRGIIIETLKVALLVLLYFSIRVTSHHFNLKFFIKWLCISVTISCFLAIIGWVMNAVGIPNVMCWQMKDYPYFGAVGRAKAFTATPGMLGSFLMMSIILLAYVCLQKNKVTKKDIFFFGLFSLTFLLAVSKTIVCAFAGLLILFWKFKGWRYKRVIYLVSISMFLFYFFASHFVISISDHKNDVKENIELGYLSDAVYESTSFSIYPSAYWEIKRGCVFLIREIFPAGVGTRQFIKQVPSLKERGIYFENTNAHDPHCTILGILTDSGLLGVIFLVISSYIVLTIFKENYKKKIFLPWLVLLIVIFVESTVTDSMNFRQYWVLLALFVTTTLDEQKNAKFLND